MPLLMRRRRSAAAASFLSIVALAAAAPPGDVGAAAPDPAARGLDLFVHAPERAVPGSKLPLQIQVLGFPTAATLAPLVGASIEAVWDPESLGPGVSRAPDAVTVKSGADGRVHIDVPVPVGDDRTLTLLLGTTYGEHRRTTELTVRRVAPRSVSLIVPDDRVVPGGATSAWALVRDTGTGRPAVNESILFELTEGGVARFSARARTDAAGTAVVRVPIPCRLSAQDLVDPWGGTMAFVKGQGQKLPFLTVQGFELHAPGPDSKLGTADDVKSPFERVVGSGTPYAQAMDEDRLVDAMLEMEVSEATVDAWRSTLQELTGITLGRGGTIGHGSGTGVGLGMGGGHGRMGATEVDRPSRGISPGAAFWLAPQRTDDSGHLRVRVPLGAVETTWRLAVVGAPDGASPAVTSIDIPSALPLSARVDAGAAWIDGDEADVIVTVRNRTASLAKVSLSLAAGGTASLAGGGATRALDVEAGGAAAVPVRVRARGADAASLQVTATAAGGLEDRTTHTWDVRPAGEVVDLTSAQWVTDEATLALTQVGPHLRATGAATLVLERGNAAAIEAALRSLDPDAISSQDGISYAMETAARVQRWATARGGEADPLAVRARELVRRSIGRMLARRQLTRVDRTWSAQRRSVAWSPPDLVSLVAKVNDCPPETSPGIEDGLLLIEAEPSSADGVIDACWDALATSVASSVGASRDPVAAARAALAFAERPHRAAMAASLADKLRAWVELRPSGGVTLPASASRSRASRALVFAALLRASGLGKQPPAATPDRLAAWLRVQRDAQGSYGSPLATLAAVRAFLNGPTEDARPATVTFTTEDGAARDVTVASNATVEVPLGAKALSVALRVTGPGVVARLVRPGLRAWSSPPDSSSSPIALDVAWPDAAKAGQKGVLRVSLSHRGPRAIVADVRIPLPPGAALAEKAAGVQQIHGVLVLRPALLPDGTATLLELPIRFGLAGTFTVPEARARLAFDDSARTIAPARPLVVR